jgi:hypothetical protein
MTTIEPLKWGQTGWLFRVRRYHRNPSATDAVIMSKLKIHLAEATPGRVQNFLCLVLEHRL